ncbi:hypothetical protein PV10_03426 [Exophiala mesophila]|uniref:Major facilitator superfamily (MFS) profile domain-containing protein n=1 Tax=Exophiala mesophila TaxID=212818 RepID=A0A0D1X206_EXOME|nr:uncharacterized protein PV10_03426 [Exophiala mesophila]KIV95820.1 hypothetical protein PV10_03426 [Exophiala mesophila]
MEAVSELKQIPSEIEVKTAEEPAFTPDPKMEKQVLRRLDALVLPIIAMMYLLSFLDRSNIGNARVAGLQKDLQMSDWAFHVAVTVTYVPYICAEIPSNLLIAKVGARRLIPGLCISWGLVTTLQCLVQSFGGLVACRFFLGLCEGGLIPGIMVYLASFYRRHELQLRVCIFFGFSALAGAFSGLLAAAIVNLHGVGGMEGWRWIFLLEGLFTVVFGIVALFLIPNNPRQVLSFKEHHAKYCEKRLKADVISNEVESTKFNLQNFLSAFTSLHIWALVLLQTAGGMLFFGLAYFMPSIVATLARSFTDTPTVVQIQLLTVPPFVFGFVGSVVVAIVSDKYQARGYTALVMQLFSIVGFAVFLGTSPTRGRVRYAAINLLIFGTYSAAPSILVWPPNNVAPYTKRATAIAMTFIGTNLGGLASSWIYPSSSAPAFRLGSILNLTSACVLWFTVAFLTYYFKHENTLKVKNREQLLRGLEDKTMHEQYEILGDRHPDFKYTP